MTAPGIRPVSAPIAPILCGRCEPRLLIVDEPAAGIDLLLPLVDRIPDDNLKKVDAAGW